MTLLSIVGIVYLSTGVGDKYLQVIELNHLSKYLHFFTLGMFAKHFSKYYTRILDSEVMRALGAGLFFILFFALRYEDVFPTIVFRFFNDIVLRYLGLFVLVMSLYESSKSFNLEGRVAKIICIIAENSFGIYLLQYFFLPDFRGQAWFSNIDPFTMFIISMFFTLITTLTCLAVISVLSKSKILCRYVLGKR